VVPARHCYHRSLTPLMEEIREQMGSGPVYISFDIDALDPSFAPGTGTSVYSAMCFFTYSEVKALIPGKSNKLDE